MTPPVQPTLFPADEEPVRDQPDPHHLDRMWDEAPFPGVETVPVGSYL